MKEKWMPIEGFSKYKVSNLGRVRVRRYLVRRCDGLGIWSFPSKILHLVKMKTGYYEVYLRARVNGKRKSIRRYVHRLAAEAFIPNLDNKPEVNHKDGIVANNIYTNLEWVTHRENIQHAAKVLGKMGGKPGSRLGSKNNAAKLTEKDIPIIRKMIEEGIGVCAISRMYDVLPCTISSIKVGRRWNHVP